MSPKPFHRQNDTASAAASFPDAERLLLLRRAEQDSDDSILITDADINPPGPHIVFVKPCFAKITGYGVHEVIGKSPRNLRGPKTEHGILERLRQCLIGGTPFFGEAIHCRSNLVQNLDFRNTAGLAKYALENGLNP